MIIRTKIPFPLAFQERIERTECLTKTANIVTSSPVNRILLQVLPPPVSTGYILIGGGRIVAVAEIAGAAWTGGSARTEGPNRFRSLSLTTGKDKSGEVVTIAEVLRTEEQGNGGKGP